MENYKIKQLKERLKKHWEFLDNKIYYEEIEILDWVADAVTLLTEMGVGDVIIKAFIETFELVEAKGTNDEYSITRGQNKIRKLGPFVSERAFFEPWGNYKNLETGKITILKIAFRSAMAILDKGLEEERIVPKWLMNKLEENGNYSNLISSLELIQTKYENKDPIDLTKNVITLLENIIDLEPSLKNSGKKLGGKLNALLEESNRNILDKFGVNNEIIRALLNSKVIRNIHTHKECELEYDIPFLVACSFAYLVIIFLEITISTGELIEDNKLK